MDQLTKALDFKLVGEQKLGSYKVYVLKATPHPGYEPPNYEAKVLTGMEGKLWIDEKTFQWVKVEATVLRPVSIGGVLAQVERVHTSNCKRCPWQKASGFRNILL